MAEATNLYRGFKVIRSSKYGTTVQNRDNEIHCIGIGGLIILKARTMQGSN
jgi:hypothetical protein